MDLLPIGHNFEASKQNAVFRMMGAGKTIKKRLAKMNRQFDKVDAAKRGQGFQLSRKEQRYRDSFARRVMGLADNIAELVEASKGKEFNTQEMRKEAITKIQALIDEALRKVGATDGVEEAERVQWARVLGYLFQVLKSIMHEYDSGTIVEDLKRLKEKVNNELAKRRERDGKAR